MIVQGVLPFVDIAAADLFGAAQQALVGAVPSRLLGVDGAVGHRPVIGAVLAACVGAVVEEIVIAGIVGAVVPHEVAVDLTALLGHTGGQEISADRGLLGGLEQVFGVLVVPAGQDGLDPCQSLGVGVLQILKLEYVGLIQEIAGIHIIGYHLLTGGHPAAGVHRHVGFGGPVIGTLFHRHPGFGCGDGVFQRAALLVGGPLPGHREVLRLEYPGGVLRPQLTELYFISFGKFLGGEIRLKLLVGLIVHVDADVLGAGVAGFAAGGGHLVPGDAAGLLGIQDGHHVAVDQLVQHRGGGGGRLPHVQLAVGVDAEYGAGDDGVRRLHAEGDGAHQQTQAQ